MPEGIHPPGPVGVPPSRGSPCRSVPLAYRCSAPSYDVAPVAMARQIDLRGVGETLAGTGRRAEQPPPPFLEIQPARTRRNGHLGDAWMRRQPLPDRRAGVAGEIVHDEE